MALLSLWILRLFRVVGSIFDLVIGLGSLIALVLFGVILGVLISKKGIRLHRFVVFIIVFAAGFFAAPFVGIAVLMAASGVSLGIGFEPIIFGGTVVVYLLLYMLLWFWLQKRFVVQTNEDVDKSMA